MSSPLEWGLVGTGPLRALPPTSISVPRHRGVDFCAGVSKSGQRGKPQTEKCRPAPVPPPLVRKNQRSDSQPPERAG